MFDQALRPGVTAGNYPQRRDQGLTRLEQAAERYWLAVRNKLHVNRVSSKRVVAEIGHYDTRLQSCSEAQLDSFIAEAREALLADGLKPAVIFKVFAATREVAFRTLSKRHYDAQLYGGWLMINGLLAEMQTGEGKTLTATLPACTAALAGIPVHIVTANDYLAERDVGLMQPLYQRLGLRGAFVVDGMGISERQSAYQCDIVHSTSQQIAFDYLRDRIEMGNHAGTLSWQYQAIRKQCQNNGKSPLLLRGLCFAIIDEADSVLIDEAATPLIITRTITEEGDAQIYSDALFLASVLMKGEDFVVDPMLNRIDLLPAGQNNLAELAAEMDVFWHNSRKRDALVKQALAARHCYLKDKHYIVKDDKVQIVDGQTGRVMADRSWEQGLHQMIEAKEGCVISERREPLARISYQQFFNRYLRLAATTGTATEVAGELKRVYGLNVVRVPTHKPCKRKLLPARVFATAATKKAAFLQSVEDMFLQKRPVLIGTRTVQESEEISELLTGAELPHSVLNARQDRHEAKVIRRAGKLLAITVATNMAGRGTDIALGQGVEQLGGLHVICVSMNDTARIDRQLFGRCARQGNPGSAEVILSLQDPEFAQNYSSAMLNLLSKLCSAGKPLPSHLARLLLRWAHWRMEKRQRGSRKVLAAQDRHYRKILAFSGKFE